MSENSVNRLNRFRAEAEAGDIESAYQLGLAHAKGEETKRDFVRAEHWLRVAAVDGHVRAQHLLGNLQFYGCSGEIKREEGSDWIRKAEEGGIKSEGVAKEDGTIVVDTNLTFETTELEELFLKHAEAGDSVSQLCLGQLYSEGYGDFGWEPQKALHWLDRAAKQGEKQAQVLRDRLMESMLRHLAEGGDPNHEYALGKFYSFGSGEIEHGMDAALIWLKKAAMNGSLEACWDLGTFYEEGEKVPQDFTEAFHWFHRAARLGLDGAQLNIGYCYYEGRGVDKNYRKAAKWYRCAAEQGNEVAAHNLSMCYEEGEGVWKSLKKAIRLLRQSAERGFGPAQSRLGYYYALGKGVKPDPCESHAWLTLAVKNGHDSATALLSQITPQLTEEELQESKRRADRYYAALEAK